MIGLLVRELLRQSLWAVGIFFGIMGIYEAHQGEAWYALIEGFVSGSGLVFALADIRDYYRILCGRLTP